MTIRGIPLDELVGKCVRWNKGISVGLILEANTDPKWDRQYVRVKWFSDDHLEVKHWCDEFHWMDITEEI